VLTRSLEMSATALALFGSTPSEVTDGQPFCRRLEQKLRRASRDKAHLTKIHLLPIPVFDEPIQVT
jgi:hypothetical protein